MTDPLLCGLCVGLCLGMTAAIGLMALARWQEDRERRALHICPFCHAPLMEPSRSYFLYAGTYRIACDNCGALGPEADSKEDALRVWYRWP